MKKIMKAMSLALVVTLMCTSIMACKKSETTKATESTTVETTTEATTTAETYPEGYPVELTDKYGTTAIVKAKPERVVSCSPACTEIIYSLGQEATLVGRTNVCNYPEAVASIESIGDMYEPNIEKIVSLNPDLIVADSSILSKASYDKMIELGLNVVILDESANFDGVYKKIEDMGKIFHADENAAKVVSDMKAELETVQEAIKDVRLHPSVYYVVGFGENGDWTATGDTFINDIITMAGGDNIAKIGTLYSYNVEDLISQDPNIIILPAWADGTFQTTAPYSELTAVKEGNVIVLPSTDTLDRQCARNPQAVEMLAKLFFPECFAEDKAA